MGEISYFGVGCAASGAASAAARTRCENRMNGLLCSIDGINPGGPRLAEGPVEWYLDPVKLAYIRWKDAVSEEASAAGSNPAHAALVELHEVRFLPGASGESVLTRMEFNQV